MKRYDIEADCTVVPMNGSMFPRHDGDYVTYDDAIEAIQQAHREGWTQAKLEAVNIAAHWRGADGVSCGDRLFIAGDISAMTYKEKCCEQTGPDNP